MCMCDDGYTGDACECPMSPETCLSRDGQVIKILHSETIPPCIHVPVLLTITKIYPYNVYYLKPQFYIAKLGYAEVYLVFLFLL